MIRKFPLSRAMEKKRDYGSELKIKDGTHAEPTWLRLSVPRVGLRPIVVDVRVMPSLFVMVTI